MRDSIRVIYLIVGLVPLLLLILLPTSLVAEDLAPPAVLSWGPDPGLLRDFADVYLQRPAEEIEQRVDPSEQVVDVELEPQELPPARRYLIAPRRP